jgi:hypothetical protein
LKTERKEQHDPGKIQKRTRVCGPAARSVHPIYVVSRGR